ncbi:MAG: hypothetical protein WAU91_04570 [Desulfatitalea sp.]
MTKWEDKGCVVCRKFWEKGQTPPMLAESIEYHSKLYKCSVCNTYWEEYERYADVVTKEVARDRYPAIFKEKDYE